MSILVKRFKGGKFAWATAIAAVGSVQSWSEDRAKACPIAADLADKVAGCHAGRLNVGRIIFEDASGTQVRASVEGVEPPKAPVKAANRDDAVKDLEDSLEAVKEKVVVLNALIGSPPKGAPASEWGPRAETWHLERANWQKEVAGLRGAVEQAVAEVAKRDAEIKRLTAEVAELNALLKSDDAKKDEAKKEEKPKDDAKPKAESKK